MTKTEKKLIYIPQGIKVKPELFTGFGTKELRQAVIMLLILGAGILLFFIISKNAAASAVMVMSAIAASVLFTTKDQNNISVVNQLGYIFRYLRIQKYYPYKYESIYQVERKIG